MSERKEVGKIQRVSFGMGGYDDVQIGISFTLGGAGWGVGDFWGFWALDRTSGTQWSEEERYLSLGQTVMRIGKLLSDARVGSVDQLRDIPVEVTFENGRISGWRVLTEVI